MKKFCRRPILLIVGVLMVCFASCNNRPTKQAEASPIDSIKVWVGDTIRCYSECTYVMLSSGWEDGVISKINRHNYEQLFKEHALPDTLDIRTALEADHLNDFEYILDREPENIIGAPLWFKYEQGATVVHDRILCIKTTRLYYHGGAEFVGETNCNYDLTSGEYIDFAYLEEGEWLPKLKRLLYKRLPEDDCYSYIIWNSPEQICFDTDLIEITENGICFYFKPYAVASFAAGFIGVEFSNEDLDILEIPTPWLSK